MKLKDNSKISLSKLESRKSQMKNSDSFNQLNASLPNSFNIKDPFVDSNIGNSFIFSKYSNDEDKKDNINKIKENESSRPSKSSTLYDKNYDEYFSKEEEETSRQVSFNRGYNLANKKESFNNLNINNSLNLNESKRVPSLRIRKSYNAYIEDNNINEKTLPIKLQKIMSKTSNKTDFSKKSKKNIIKSNYKFITKLTEILSIDKISHIISWSEDGTCIEIKNQRKFTDEVLPEHFKHSNYSNFIRQLNMYHFKKVKKYKIPSIIAYSNQYFKKGADNLIAEINRKNQHQNLLNIAKENSSFENNVETLANDKFIASKLNFLFNRMFDLELKIKQLTGVNETLINNNITFAEDIKDKNYYINMLENLIFFIVNNILPNNIVINNNNYGYGNKELLLTNENEITETNQETNKIVLNLIKEESLLECCCNGYPELNIPSNKESGNIMVKNKILINNFGENEDTNSNSSNKLNIKNSNKEEGVSKLASFKSEIFNDKLINNNKANINLLVDKLKLEKSKLEKENTKIINCKKCFVADLRKKITPNTTNIIKDKELLNLGEFIKNEPDDKKNSDNEFLFKMILSKYQDFSKNKECYEMPKSCIPSFNQFGLIKGNFPKLPSGKIKEDSASLQQNENTFNQIYNPSNISNSSFNNFSNMNSFTNNDLKFINTKIEAEKKQDLLKKKRK